MENTIHFKNSPQSGDDDKHSAQNPTITTPAYEGKGKGPVVAAAADDKKEAPPADATVPDAERAEKANAGGGQKAGRKRAREAAAGEGSEERDNQGGGGGAGGFLLPLEEMMKLTTCPWEGCSSVFDNRRALFLHVSVHIRRPWLKLVSSSSTTPPVPGQELDEEKAVEGGEAAPPEGDNPAAVAGGAATDEARKAKQAEIDLNVKQFLLPDLNLHPSEHRNQEAQD